METAGDSQPGCRCGTERKVGNQVSSTSSGPKLNIKNSIKKYFKTKNILI